MIISPPFLPTRQSNETDEQFIERSMVAGGAGDGGYPVSFELNWHGGIHLTAPREANVALPVRAIADGMAVYVRAPTPLSTDPGHPQNYRGRWTDNGCVVIQHETHIGADANTDQPTSVTFFSITCHLRSIDANVQQGRRIFRKQELGSAGSIYGSQDRIHFEIICDDDNVQRLTGRRDVYSDVQHDGRTNAVFGSIYFLVLIDTPFRADDPASNPAAPVVFTSSEAFFIRMTFAHGSCTMETLHLDGRQAAPPITEADYEYDLYHKATTLYPQSPSAGYELLRFGRVLGPDPMVPANAAHWRRIAYPGGIGWVDLNAASVRRFSDADFPHWDRWWMLVDGSSSADSRCRELAVLQLLDSDHDLNVTPQEAQQTLNNPEVQMRLARKICKFQTEWDDGTIDSRFGWLKTDPRINMSAHDFARFKSHVSSLCFWNQAKLGLDGKCWHFNPKAFIHHFRQCGWLSLDELTQLMPRWPTGAQTAHTDIGWVTARSRFQPHAINLNKMFRKYNILNAERQTHFLAQTYIETDLWRTMREYGLGRPRADGTWPAPAMQYYTVFYGRGIMQLTWPANYEAYGSFRHFAPLANLPYADTFGRITQQSTHYWVDPRDSHGNVVGTPHLWYPRFDPEIVADDGMASCDSGGFYWISKNIGRHRLNVNRVADHPFTTASVGTISVLVNGGGYGFTERQRYAAYIYRYRSDDTSTGATANFQANHGHTAHQVTVDFTPQRP